MGMSTNYNSNFLSVLLCSYKTSGRVLRRYGFDPYSLMEIFFKYSKYVNVVSLRLIKPHKLGSCGVSLRTSAVRWEYRKMLTGRVIADLWNDAPIFERYVWQKQV